MTFEITRRRPGANVVTRNRYVPVARGAMDRRPVRPFHGQQTLFLCAAGRVETPVLGSQLFFATERMLELVKCALPTTVIGVRN